LCAIAVVDRRAALTRRGRRLAPVRPIARRRRWPRPTGTPFRQTF
jgi:hypothetical protein